MQTETAPENNAQNLNDDTGKPHDQNHISENVVSVESVESPKQDSNQDSIPESTKSTISEKSKFLLMHMQKFVYKETVMDMYRYAFYEDKKNQDLTDIFIEFEKHFKLVFEMLSTDPKWSAYLDIIFFNNYPLRTKECLVNGAFSHLQYTKGRTQRDSSPITFKTKLYTPIKMNRKLLSVITPTTHKIDLEKRTAEQTVETVRVSNLEALSVLKSNLHEVTIFDRPVYRVKNGWVFNTDEKLPRKTMAVDLTSEQIDYSLLKEFVKDLKESFSWENSDHAINYLGYLIQPMLTHLMPGQMPAYSFLGPTKSGKNFLSEILAKSIYNNGIKATAIVKKLLSSQYELDVFLAELSGVIYIVFDEIKNASDEDMKVIDSIATSEIIQYRKMRYGYVQIPNHFVLALTSVHKMFTDETEGRLVKIELTQSTPLQVQHFYEKWNEKMPVLLATLLSKINSVSYTQATPLPIVEDRRSGFRLMSYFVKEVFGESPNYSVSSSTSDILDELCEMYEFYKTKPDKLRNRYPPKNICDYLALNRRNGYSRGKVINELSTALGYTSTKLNPNYKDTGYPSEAGKYYHIRIAKEKNGTNPPRHFIYIDPVIEKNFSNENTNVSNINALVQGDDNYSYFDQVRLMARESYNDINKNKLSNWVD